MASLNPGQEIGKVIGLKGVVRAESGDGVRILEKGGPVYQGEKIVTESGMTTILMMMTISTMAMVMTTTTSTMVMTTMVMVMNPGTMTSPGMSRSRNRLQRPLLRLQNRLNQRTTPIPHIGEPSPPQAGTRITIGSPTMVLQTLSSVPKEMTQTST